MTTTRIRVEVRDGRHQVRTTAGLLRAQRQHGPADRARVALVGQTALLLGGDEVRVDVEVGPGAVLELADVAATVAYHGRGRPAGWHTIVRLGPDARLSYAGQPLVVSNGAAVTRSLILDLADGASAWLRETVVLGRAGEVGGRLDASTVLCRTGEEFCREQLLLDPRTRDRPGVLTGIRVLDSVLWLGAAPPGPAPLPSERRSGSPNLQHERPDVATYALLDEGSTITRFLGSSLADSPLG